VGEDAAGRAARIVRVHARASAAVLGRADTPAQALTGAWPGAGRVVGAGHCPADADDAAAPDDGPTAPPIPVIVIPQPPRMDPPTEPWKLRPASRYEV
jgi:hypothetical protein